MRGVSLRRSGPGQLAGPPRGRFCFRRSRNQGALARCARMPGRLPWWIFSASPAGAGRAPARLSSPPTASCPRQGRADRRGHALRRIALRAAVAAVFSRRLEYRARRRLISTRRRRGAGNARQGRARLPSFRRRQRPLRRLHRSRLGISRQAWRQDPVRPPAACHRFCRGPRHRPRFRRRGVAARRGGQTHSRGSARSRAGPCAGAANAENYAPIVNAHFNIAPPPDFPPFWASSMARSNGCSRFRTGFRSRSAAPIACSMSRAKSSPNGFGRKWRK